LLFWVDDYEINSGKVYINITVVETNEPPSIDKITLSSSEIYPGERVKITVDAFDNNLKLSSGSLHSLWSLVP